MSSYLQDASSHLVDIDEEELEKETAEISSDPTDNKVQLFLLILLILVVSK